MNQNLRDIQINYKQWKINIKVEQNEVVSSFFRKQLPQKIREEFISKYKDTQGITKIINFQNLSHFQITLNTLVQKSQENVIDPKIGSATFYRYAKNKRLTFYIHKIQKNGLSKDIQIKGKQNHIKFSLLRGSHIEDIKQLDISNYKYQQLQKQIRQGFKLNEGLQFKFINRTNDKILRLNNLNKSPIKILRELNIYEVGILPIYENGRS